MITNKYITKIIAVIMVLACALCLGAMAFSDELSEALGGSTVNLSYESELFDTSEPLDINIVIDEDDWNEMLENAMSETYYECAIEINGETFSRVGIRPKGNTSLMSIANDPDTDRYSFKVEFDQYVDDQSCYGLDKLVLNNNYADATNMKEALVYDMYQFLDADASLYNYAKISVNGEYWGVYLALEGVEDSFMLRNYGTQNGDLYKPENMGMGGGGDENGAQMSPPDNAGGEMPADFDPSQMGNPPDQAATDDGQAASSEEATSNGNEASAQGTAPGGDPPEGGEMPDMGDFGGGMSSGGSDLNYTDDELDSYSSIWDGAVTDSTDSDHKRVVTALKNISEGNDLEKYMDINNLLKYMAVHIFSVNEDSLSGMMAHNYYLYETDGQLNLIPWDYNLAFGGMGGMGGGGQSDGATSVVNSAIDDAFDGTEFFDTLMENDEYSEKYHSYLEQLVNEYVDGGGFESFYNRTRSQIDSLVESDPTAFYTADEYEDAVTMLKEIVALRGESIQGQLDGTIPSTDSEQRNSDTLIDASDLDTSVMGTMSQGGGGQGGPMGGDEPGAASGDTQPGQAADTDIADANENAAADTETVATAARGSSYTLVSLTASTAENASDSANAAAATNDSGDAAAQGQPPAAGNMQAPPNEAAQASGDNAASAGDASSTDTTATDGADAQAAGGQQGQMPDFGQGGGGMPGGMGGDTATDSGNTMMSNLIMIGATLAILLVVFFIALLYRRRPRKRYPLKK